MRSNKGIIKAKIHNLGKYPKELYNLGKYTIPKHGIIWDGIFIWDYSYLVNDTFGILSVWKIIIWENILLPAKELEGELDREREKEQRFILL